MEGRREASRARFSPLDALVAGTEEDVFRRTAHSGHSLLETAVVEEGGATDEGIGARAGAFAAGLEVVSEEAGVVTFSPEALATPIMSAVIDTVKYSALIALIFIGVYIIIKMFSGKKA